MRPAFLLLLLLLPSTLGAGDPSPWRSALEEILQKASERYARWNSTHPGTFEAGETYLRVAQTRLEESDMEGVVGALLLLHSELAFREISSEGRARPDFRRYVLDWSAQALNDSYAWENETRSKLKEEEGRVSTTRGLQYLLLSAEWLVVGAHVRSGASIYLDDLRSTVRYDPDAPGFQQMVRGAVVPLEQSRISYEIASTLLEASFKVDREGSRSLDRLDLSWALHRVERALRQSGVSGVQDGTYLDEGNEAFGRGERILGTSEYLTYVNVHYVEGTQFAQRRGAVDPEKLARESRSLWNATNALLPTLEYLGYDRAPFEVTLSRTRTAFVVRNPSVEALSSDIGRLLSLGETAVFLEEASVGPVEVGGSTVPLLAFLVLVGAGVGIVALLFVLLRK